MSWETTSRAGSVESASRKKVQRVGGGDDDIRSTYCTEASSSFNKKTLPPWALPRKVPPGQTATPVSQTGTSGANGTSRDLGASKTGNQISVTRDGRKIERFDTGFTSNVAPVFNETPYDPVPHPLDLPPNLQRQAQVSRRLELEGDVFGSMNSTTYTKPPVPQPTAPKSVAMEVSGFTHNTHFIFENQLADQDVEERDFQKTGVSPGSTMLPSAKLTAKKKNALDAENDFKGPDRFSTSYRTAFKPHTMSRGPIVKPSNEFVTDADLSIGGPEPSGFSKSVTDIYAHQLSKNETMRLEPTAEFVAQMDLTGKKTQKAAGGGSGGGGSGGGGEDEEGSGKPNPLIEDAAYYQLHPEVPRTFRTQPPSISRLSYLPPPRFTGKEDLPTAVYVQPSGNTINYGPSLGRTLGAGNKEEWDDDAEDFIDDSATRAFGESRKLSQQNGMGHEAESMTQEEIRRVRASDPMEFEYLRIGNTMKSVSQLSYLPPPKATHTKPPPSTDSEFLSTMSGKISHGAHLTPDERASFVGSIQDRHYGLGSGKVGIKDSTLNSSADLHKEPTGFTSNVLPYIQPKDIKEP